MKNPPLSVRSHRALVALVLYPDATTNRVVHDRFGFKIEPAERDELVTLGLIQCWRGPRNAYVHQLTNAGLKQCRQELQAATPEATKPADRLLFATWQVLARTLPERLYELRTHLGISPPLLPEQILATYRELTSRPGGPVGLDELRDLLGADRNEVDRVLLEMDDADQILLEPDPDQVGLTPQAREAAVQLAGRPMHVMRVRGE